MLQFKLLHLLLFVTVFAFMCAMFKPFIALVFFLNRRGYPVPICAAGIATFGSMGLSAFICCTSRHVSLPTYLIVSALGISIYAALWYTGVFFQVVVHIANLLTDDKVDLPLAIWMSLLFLHGMVIVMLPLCASVIMLAQREWGFFPATRPK